MDSIERIGSTEFATRMALIRINAITGADQFCSGWFPLVYLAREVGF